jgi:hypothetical protein
MIQAEKIEGFQKQLSELEVKHEQNIRGVEENV